MQRVVTLGSMRGVDPLDLVSTDTPTMTWQTLFGYSLLAGLGVYLASQAQRGAFSGLYSYLLRQV